MHLCKMTTLGPHSLLALAFAFAMITIKQNRVDAFSRQHLNAQCVDRRLPSHISVRGRAGRSGAISQILARRAITTIDEDKSHLSDCHLKSEKFKNFEEMLKQYHGEAVMVLFASTNCGPCKLQKKELALVSSKMAGAGVKMFTIDTEKWPHIGSRFRVRTLPCVILVKEEQVLVRLEGLTKAADLVTQVQAILR